MSCRLGAGIQTALSPDGKGRVCNPSERSGNTPNSIFSFISEEYTEIVKFFHRGQKIELS